MSYFLVCNQQKSWHFFFSLAKFMMTLVKRFKLATSSHFPLFLGFPVKQPKKSRPPPPLQASFFVAFEHQILGLRAAISPIWGSTQRNWWWVKSKGNGIFSLFQGNRLVGETFGQRLVQVLAKKKSEPNHCRLGIFFPNGGGLGLGKCPQNALKRSGLGIIIRQFIATNPLRSPHTLLVVKSKGILPKNERKMQVKDFFPYAHCSLLHSWFWRYLNTEPNRVWLEH